MSGKGGLRPGSGAGAPTASASSRPQLREIPVTARARTFCPGILHSGRRHFVGVACYVRSIGSNPLLEHRCQRGGSDMSDRNGTSARQRASRRTGTSPDSTADHTRVSVSPVLDPTRIGVFHPPGPTGISNVRKRHRQCARSDRGRGYCAGATPRHPHGGAA